MAQVLREGACPSGHAPFLYLDIWSWPRGLLPCRGGKAGSGTITSGNAGGDENLNRETRRDACREVDARVGRRGVRPESVSFSLGLPEGSGHVA